MKRIGIIGAMEIEVSLLKDMMTAPGCKSEISVTKAGGLEYFEGFINGVQIVVVKSGVGKVNAALCAQFLILHFGVTHIINTGIAGAMAHGLGVLDFVVSTDAVYHDMDVTGFGYKPTQIPQMKVSCFAADTKMIQTVQKCFPEIPEAAGHKLIAGRIASGDQFIADKKIKEHIRQICSPACVEMEGAAIAHTAFLNSTPFIIIRCMSDEADDNNESVSAFNEPQAAALSAKIVAAVIKNI